MFIKKEWDQFDGNFSLCPTLTATTDLKPEYSVDGATTLCQICDQFHDGCHFGVISCRACAAFYRRSIAAAKIYVCKGDGNCQIRNVEQRKMCKFCRFKQCEAAGMNRSGVQLNRDRIGTKRNSTDYLRSSDTDTNSSDSYQYEFDDDEDEPSSSGISFEDDIDITNANEMTTLTGDEQEQMQLSLIRPPYERTPLLTRMTRGYENYHCAQKFLHSALYPEAQGKFFKTDLIQTQKMERGCLEFINEMKENFFPPYNTLTVDVKQQLLGSFEKLFRALDRNSKSCRFFADNKNFLYMHYGQYVDIADVFSFFNDVDSPESLTKLAVPICDASLRLRVKLEELKIRDCEVAALAGLLLWRRVAGITSNQNSEVIRDRIVQELHDDLMETYGPKETPSRLTELIYVLHKLDLVVKELDVALTTIKLFDMFPIDPWEFT
ncbi:Nhr-33 [Aphelenchoides besseyi]|nr:Nhr-33 [Aphelenchoides besseyi]